jgi:hypothetical protein
MYQRFREISRVCTLVAVCDGGGAGLDALLTSASPTSSALEAHASHLNALPL